jgi:hypothetical protein
VFFENVPEATAPAANVVLVDVLNTAAVDLATLKLGPIAFGSHIITPPIGALTSSGTYTSTVDLRPEQNLSVRMTASIESQTGLLKWTFTSLDPLTGEPPDDPLAGFLPPGGEGVVYFTVAPRAEASVTGFEHRNSASIIFDANDPIPTPEWVNTIDAQRPSSSVLALPAESATAFTVSWSGADVGAGVRDYSVFVSNDGSDYQPFVTETSQTSSVFEGVAGHAYSFYSIARDFVGNVESSKSGADATTLVVADLTPPVILYEVSGTQGDNGWYVSSVGVQWTVLDPESGVSSLSGCDSLTLTSDTFGVALTCRASNGVGLSTSISLTIKIDKTPPSVNGIPTNCSLWPPNGQLVSVATVRASDELSGVVADSFVANAASNEPTNTEADIVLNRSSSGVISIQVRAKRLGTGAGRVYSLSASAADKAGNRTTVVGTCVVPHDQVR